MTAAVKPSQLAVAMDKMKTAQRKVLSSRCAGVGMYLFMAYLCLSPNPINGSFTGFDIPGKSPEESTAFKHGQRLDNYS
tara:strand:+ start:1097 stop:1333 length:237 start_codon:yes stop_codon:yes gene_type:complete